MLVAMVYVYKMKDSELFLVRKDLDLPAKALELNLLDHRMRVLEETCILFPCVTRTLSTVSGTGHGACCKTIYYCLPLLTFLAFPRIHSRNTGYISYLFLHFSEFIFYLEKANFRLFTCILSNIWKLDLNTVFMVSFSNINVAIVKVKKSMCILIVFNRKEM